MSNQGESSSKRKAAEGEGGTERAVKKQVIRFQKSSELILPKNALLQLGKKGGYSIYTRTDKPSTLKIQPHALNNPSLRVNDLDQLRIRRTLCRTACLVVEAEFGSRDLKGRNFVFKPDVERDPVIVKLMELADPTVDKIYDEFDKNSTLAAKDPESDIIVHTYCYSHARWMTEEQGENGNDWVDTGRLRVVLMPAHIPFTVAMKSSSYSSDQMKRLWRSGYDKILQFHERFDSAHRDIKAENMVVKAEWKDGELEAVEPLEARIIDVVTALSDAPGGLGIGAMLGVFDGTATYVPQSTALTWMRETFRRCAASNPYLAGPLPPKSSQPASSSEGKAAPPEMLYDEEGKVYKPKFNREQVVRADEILDYLSSPRPSRDNDVWAWGISMLKAHDLDYVSQTCYRASDLAAFQEAFPLYGPTGTYSDMISFINGLQKRFSAIYDHRTYKAEGSKIPPVYHPVLDVLLGRSKGSQCYAVDPEGALPNHLKALRFPLPDDSTPTAPAAPSENPPVISESEAPAPDSKHVTEMAASEKSQSQSQAIGEAHAGKKGSLTLERKAIASHRDHTIDFLVPPTGSKTADGEDILWLTKLVCPLGGCDTGKDGGPWESTE